MSDLVRNTLPASDMRVGSGTVGTSPIVATGVGFVGLNRGVTIRADDDNDGIIYVAGGFILKAGEKHTFEVDDSTRLLVVASEEGQEFSWCAQ